MSDEPQQKAYTVAEAAKAYSVSVSTIRVAIRSGDLIAKRLSNTPTSTILIAASELKDWFDALPTAS